MTTLAAVALPVSKGPTPFRRTGQHNGVGPIAQIGINVLNGDGTIGLIRTTRSTNGEILDWTDQPNGHPPPNGTYTVDPDCTGTFLNNLNNLVVLDGGKRFFLLSVSPDTITTEEGKRFEVED